MKTRIAAFVISVVSVAAGFAQGPSLTNVTIEPDSKHPLYSLHFDVRLPSGELLDNLATNAVTIEENGRRLSGTLAPGNPHGVAYAIVLDTSGSMAPRLEAIKPALKDLVSRLTSRDMAALITFNDDATIVQPLTADSSTIESSIDKVRTGGHTTELYYAVSKASEVLAAPGVPARRVMVVISDGKDEGTAYTLDDVIKKSTAAGANIAAIGIAGGDSRYLKTLQRMADLTNGTYIQIDPGQPWQEKTRLVKKFVDSRYHFAWRSALAADGKAHKVTLDVNLGDGTVLTKELTITLPKPHPTPVVPEPGLPLWQLVAGIGAGLMALALIWVLLVRRARSRRKGELAEVEKKVDAEREAKEQLKADVERGLGDLREKLATLEQKAPVLGATPPAAAKKRTVYSPGNPPAGGAHSYARATLHVLDGQLEGSKLPLLDVTTIGRDDDNNIVLEEQRVSLHHARVSKANGTYWLEDLGSTNGTYVGEQRLSARTALNNGETIRIGSVSMQFVAET